MSTRSPEQGVRVSPVEGLGSGQHLSWPNLIDKLQRAASWYCCGKAEENLDVDLGRGDVNADGYTIEEQELINSR